MSAIDRFEAILAGGDDNAGLRFALGNEYLKQNRADEAIEHLQVAVSLDPAYSAAWKLLGRAQTELDRREDAMRSYERGIAVATERGDVQAAKEMGVFLKRLQADG